jgi:hypothetical protein
MGISAASAGAARPLRDYGPRRSSVHRRRLRLSRTIQGLRAGRRRGRTKQEYPAASGRPDHSTFWGAGRRVSPMHGTRSQSISGGSVESVHFRFVSTMGRMEQWFFIATNQVSPGPPTMFRQFSRCLRVLGCKRWVLGA